MLIFKVVLCSLFVSLWILEKFLENVGDGEAAIWVGACAKGIGGGLIFVALFF